MGETLRFGDPILQQTAISPTFSNPQISLGRYNELYTLVKGRCDQIFIIQRHNADVVSVEATHLLTEHGKSWSEALRKENDLLTLQKDAGTFLAEFAHHAPNFGGAVLSVFELLYYRNFKAGTCTLRDNP